MLYYDRIDVSEDIEGIEDIRKVHQNNVLFANTDTF